MVVDMRFSAKGQLYFVLDASGSAYGIGPPSEVSNEHRKSLVGRSLCRYYLFIIIVLNARSMV